MNHCGIDLANKASAHCTIDEHDRVLREGKAPTDEEGLREAVEGLLPLRAIIEACPLAEWAAGVLEGLGCEAVVIDPRAAKHLVSSKKKTDARDARTLARIGRSGWYTAVHRKSEAARESRSRLQGRQALMKVKKALLSAIRGLLRAHGLRLGPVSEGAFAERVRAVVRGRVPGLAATFEHLLETWEQARQGTDRLERQIERASQEDEVTRLLKTVPGVGPLVSTVYKATIDDPSRFRRGEEVADYVGLVPRVYQSGEVEYRGRITKEGDGLLRWHLVEAAHVLLTKGRDCALKRWGLELEKRKGAAKARVAVARKLCLLLWRLWLRGEAFKPWPQGVPA
jgi:transposase